ncbi:unnamed protein product [Cyclocybe aegerita]|uniref:Uncharacterized protein n=1 Tax=Cyclocybe aegerita TaxID=1973307 RepID=A0A8S0W0R4_CYCAE|nr:unnamed protein product [Cyclocybe aegerita]
MANLTTSLQVSPTGSGTTSVPSFSVSYNSDFANDTITATVAPIPTKWPTIPSSLLLPGDTWITTTVPATDTPSATWVLSFSRSEDSPAPQDRTSVFFTTGHSLWSTAPSNQPSVNTDPTPVTTPTDSAGVGDISSQLSGGDGFPRPTSSFDNIILLTNTVAISSTGGPATVAPLPTSWPTIPIVALPGDPAPDDRAPLSISSLSYSTTTSSGYLPTTVSLEDSPSPTARTSLNPTAVGDDNLRKRHLDSTEWCRAG